MVGQKRLLKTIENLTVATMPRTLMLIGPTGSGRHTLCELIASKLDMELKNISDKISLETMNDIYMYPLPRVYVIDMDKIVETNQAQRYENVMLKLLEEPLKNSYIILICEQATKVLPTVLNRCIQWKLDPYSIDELKMFTLNENILKIAETPGQIISLCQSTQLDCEADMLQEIIDYCSLIVEKIDVATSANALAICNKISYDSKTVEKGKYPIDIFMKTLLYMMTQYYMQEDNKNGYEMYLLTKETASALKVAYVDREQVFSRFIIQLREIKKGTAK